VIGVTHWYPPPLLSSEASLEQVATYQSIEALDRCIFYAPNDSDNGIRFYEVVVPPAGLLRNEGKLPTMDDAINDDREARLAKFASLSVVADNASSSPSTIGVGMVTTTWQCTRCTLVNSCTRERCAACDTLRTAARLISSSSNDSKKKPTTTPTIDSLYTPSSLLTPILRLELPIAARTTEIWPLGNNDAFIVITAGYTDAIHNRPRDGYWLYHINYRRWHVRPVLHRVPFLWPITHSSTHNTITLGCSIGGWDGASHNDHKIRFCRYDITNVLITISNIPYVST
jgi:hypothetical protein